MTRSGKWFILALLVLSVTINYIDRGNLSVAADRLAKELQLDPEKIGVLLMAFFCTYAPFQIVSGWLIDRFSVYWIFAVGFFLWSGATILTGLAGTFIAILILRLILGIGESVAYPSYSKIIAQAYPPEQRGLANGLIDAGCKAGPALGLMIGSVIISHYGWRSLFLVIGGASLAWLVPWFLATMKGPAISTPAHLHPDAGPGLMEIFRERSAWGSFLSLFCSNYAWYFLITWLPWYLVRERHHSEAEMGLFGSMAFWTVGIASLGSGWISDKLVQRGGSPTFIRKMFAAGGMAGSSVMAIVPLLDDERASLAVLMVACVAYGCYSSHLWLIAQTLAGPAAAGRWTGAQNAIGNLAGVAAPWLTGRIVRDTGHFSYPFAIVGALLAIGALSYVFIIGPIEPISWRSKQLSTTAE